METWLTEQGEKACIQCDMRLNLLKTRTEWHLGNIFNATMAGRSYMQRYEIIDRQGRGDGTKTLAILWHDIHDMH